MRGALSFICMLLALITFDFAANANVNQGVIGGLLAANIIYSSIIFYVGYKEKISYPTMAAMLLIIAGVMCVSVKDSQLK
jgi:ABC-type transport system involved in cytochrome c biogenesis permease subunit